jgi:hypothetical protein
MPKAAAGRPTPGIPTSGSTSVAAALATGSRCPTSLLPTWTRRSTGSRLWAEALSIPGRGGRSVGTPRAAHSDLPSTPAPRSGLGPDPMRRAVARCRPDDPCFVCTAGSEWEREHHLLRDDLRAHPLATTNYRMPSVFLADRERRHLAAGRADAHVVGPTIVGTRWRSEVVGRGPSSHHGER